MLKTLPGRDYKAEAEAICETMMPRGCVTWVVREGMRIAFAAAGRKHEYEELLGVAAAARYDVVAVMRALRGKFGFTITQFDLGDNDTKIHLGGVDDVVTRPVYWHARTIATDPFWVGCVPKGKHAMMGCQRFVSECHWTKGPGEPDLFEIDRVDRYLATHVTSGKTLYVARAPSIGRRALQEVDTEPSFLDTQFASPLPMHL